MNVNVMCNTVTWSFKVIVFSVYFQIKVLLVHEPGGSMYDLDCQIYYQTMTDRQKLPLTFHLGTPSLFW